MGAKAFVDLCRKLEAKHGARFKPNKLLLDMMASGGTFYGAAQARKAA
jgi:3-hydroxyacyl-CoA dehydrogenase/enoyl-CoA hydratase/3-hydroxybutyryl-CoA epimerase